MTKRINNSILDWNNIKKKTKKNGEKSFGY